MIGLSATKLVAPPGISGEKLGEATNRIKNKTCEMANEPVYGSQQLRDIMGRLGSIAM